MKITLPDSWSDVTVEQFAQFKGLDLKDNLIEIVSIFSGETVEAVEVFPPESWPEIIDKIGWMFKLPEEKLNKCISIGDKEYFLMNLSDMTIRQWTDLIFAIRDQKKNLHKIFAILYGGEPEVFLNAKIADLYGAMLFFSHIENEYSKNMQYSLMTQMMQMTKRDKIRQKIMDRLRRFPGMKWYTALQKESLQT